MEQDDNITDRIVNRLMSMTPEEVLVHIRTVCFSRPESTAILDVLILAYRELCELRLEETLSE